MQKEEKPVATTYKPEKRAFGSRESSMHEEKLKKIDSKLGPRPKSELRAQVKEKKNKLSFKENKDLEMVETQQSAVLS